MRTALLTAAALAALVPFASTATHAGWDEGVAAFTSKNYRKAIVEFKQVVRRAPTNWEARVYLGRSYTELGDFRRAEQALRSAQRIAPPADDAARSRIWKQLGYTYEKQKKYARAHEAYMNAGEREAAVRVEALREEKRDGKKPRAGTEQRTVKEKPKR